MNKEHGSPYDRGAADSYYRRRRRPHKWVDGNHFKESTDLTADEIQQYNQGFDDNEAERNYKDWGDGD